MSVRFLGSPRHGLACALLVASGFSTHCGNESEGTDIPFCPSMRFVAAYPVDDGCVDLSKPLPMGCPSSVTGAPEGCVFREATNTRYFPAALPADGELPAGWRVCTVEELTDMPSISCELTSACERPMRSTCSKAQTCAAFSGGCGGQGQLDENGCARRPCSSDADCESSEICVAGNTVKGSSCRLFEDSCSCGGLLTTFPGKWCAPK